MLGRAPAHPCWVAGPEGSSLQGGQHGFETRTGAALAAPRGHVLSPSTEEPAALSRSAGGGDAASPLAAMRFCPALEAPSQAGLGTGAGGLCPWRREGSAGGGTVSSRRETGPGRPGRRPPRRCCSPGRRGGAGRGAVASQGHPRSPPQQTGVQPPALPLFSLTVMGPGHLVATSGGWSGCPEDTAPSDGGLDRLCAVAARNKSCPSPPRFKDGGVGEASTPVFLPSGPGAGGAEAGAYKAGCLQAGRGREEQAWGCTRRRASAGGMWLFPSGHWRGPSPRKVCPQASVQNRGDGTPAMAPPLEAPRVRRAGWPVGEGPTAQPRPLGLWWPANPPTTSTGGGAGPGGSPTTKVS